MPGGAFSFTTSSFIELAPPPVDKPSANLVKQMKVKNLQQLARNRGFVGFSKYKKKANLQKFILNKL